MTIDLDTTEGRKEYIADKFEDLLDGINDSYGTVLMEELLKRLELTIRDFNDEIKILCDQLIVKQEERQHLLEMLRSNKEISSQTPKDKTSSSSNDPNADIIKSEKLSEGQDPQFESDIPVWEQKLSKLEKK